jgi:hypothetical protein
MDWPRDGGSGSVCEAAPIWFVGTCRSCNITCDGSNGHLGIGAAAIGQRALTGLKTNAGIPPGGSNGRPCLARG